MNPAGRGGVGDMSTFNMPGLGGKCEPSITVKLPKNVVPPLRMIDLVLEILHKKRNTIIPPWPVLKQVVVHGSFFRSPVPKMMVVGSYLLYKDSPLKGSSPIVATLQRIPKEAMIVPRGVVYILGL